MLTRSAFSALVPTNKPSTSLSSELTAPSRLRLPLFAFTSPPRTLTLPGLPASRTSSSSTTQRLASLFGPKPEDSPQSDPVDDPLSLPIRVLQAPGPSLASAALDLALRDALKHRIRDSLDSLDESVLSTIDSFLDRLSRDPPQGTSSLYLAPPGEVAEALQTLYETIEVEVAKEYEEPVIVDHTLELLEEVLCVELYDRLYASIIDEDLGETIDRLGLADLSLDQLGFDLERREMDEPERIAALRMGLDQIISAATTVG
ncbi:hypothetical protein CROQUDRAFT_463528 [Cronartium quercuum f. sp. fusiforme G11]|uniref:Uncharacterized protein n=1 Tax=Cronartium quercuum f. sp. fusiforme G11 TaxID=708437 RepID=A0A9P6NU91_9BASI|nr:hypothetical protein CROQUDRAFT_463528 [Cronartium quercuum f. sp. fusiforme G11]